MKISIKCTNYLASYYKDREYTTQIESQMYNTCVIQYSTFLCKTGNMKAASDNYFFVVIDNSQEAMVRKLAAIINRMNMLY